jgi:hypothetical protein
VKLKPISDISLSENTSAFIEMAVITVQPRLPDLAVERVVGLLVVDGRIVLDGPERNSKILGPVAKGQQITETSVDLRAQVLAAASGGAVAEGYELIEEDRLRLDGGVGVDRHHEDLARRIADHTVEIEGQDMHDGRV